VSPEVAVIVALALLAGNAFFVGAEFALISARRSQIEPLAADGSRRAAITLRAMERVSLMMACAQLGITACSIGLGAVGEPAVARLLDGPLGAVGVPDAWVHPVAFAVALAVVVYLHMVLGEMVPKNIAIAGPERAALLLGPPLAGIARAVEPLLRTLNGTANLGLRAVGVRPREEIASAFTAEEVASLMAESRREGLLDEEELQLLTGALTFGERTVDAVALPRHGLRVLAPDATAADVQAATAETGYSRFPVAAGGDFHGYVHVKDALGEDAGDLDRPLPDGAMRPLAVVAPGDTLRRALAAMQARGAHMAVVRDENGLARGIVALEDVLEELVGEVADAAQQVGARRRPA